MNKFDLKSYLAEKKSVVDAELKSRLPRLDEQLSTLSKAMEYTLTAGGKRLRPILCMAAAELVGGNPNDVLPTAAALEYIHTYSLIHDDLPLMDDDDLRRGKPTCHTVFGEAEALLAGDALLTEAFRILSEQARTVDSDLVIKVVGQIATAAGANGMVGGQVADMEAENCDDIELEHLRYIHARKTGALITVSLTSGAILAKAGSTDIKAITVYGECVGQAFQIMDDILDVVGDEEKLGKPINSDDGRGKATYPSIIGLEKARSEARFLIEKAVSALAGYKERAKPLISLATYIIERDR